METQEQIKPRFSGIASQQRFPRMSGMVSPADQLHQIVLPPSPQASPDEHYIAPLTINVAITTPPKIGTIGIPQYSPTVRGASPMHYSPSTDCQGAFTSAYFQPNNNCYNYSCDIATNTFAQPGRQNGFLITADTLNGPTIESYAQKDGLLSVGKTIADCIKFRKANPSLDGHFVALMISPLGDINWPGDYHWARCDNSSGLCNSWSQKDGNDQITNFDFAGNLISDPSQANWTVNQGPLSVPTAPATSSAPPQSPDVIVTYFFYTFMFVPYGKVNIL